MQELETLLTSLVQRGWKPFWKERCFRVDRVDKSTYEVNCGNIWYRYSLRQITSIDSWLWEFCVENELTHWYNWDEWKYTETFPWDYRDYPADEYKYRLIESALIPEEELWQFLIDNIIVKWPGKN